MDSSLEKAKETNTFSYNDYEGMHNLISYQEKGITLDKKK